jgi:hypothetical protein
MVAFRKWSPALAVLAFMAIPAVAQTTAGQPLQCFANAGVPPVVRAEGYTELTGDLVITCQGGNPAAPFLANFQLFLNTNITSRLVVGDHTSEALLMIDEPGLARLDAAGNPTATTTPFCVSPAIINNSDRAQALGGAGAAPGWINSGLGPACNPAAANLPPGSPGAFNPNNTFQQGSYTIFRAGRSNQPNTTIGGQSVGNENVLVWAGIPVLPPGSNRTRTFRITNVRANANGLGASQTLIPTQILAYISVFPQGTLPIDNPQQTVGYVQQGLVFDRRSCSNGSFDFAAQQTFNQCTSTGNQRDFFSDPLRTGNLAAASALRYREGFQTAFKPRIIGDPLTPSGSQWQSVPGVVYNSESGFVRSDIPELVNVGLANSGTRLAARFSNIPAGVKLFVSRIQAPLGTGAAGGASAAALVDATDLAGAGGAPLGGQLGVSGIGQGTIGCGTTNTVPIAEVQIVNGQGLAVWEILSSNPSAIDEILFYYAVAYRHNPGQGVPALGTATVIGNFAPFYTANNAVERMQVSTYPIPRFAASTSSSDLFRIQICQTNLLFPYVTNWAGFDTGIAIANTSTDPFGSPADRVQAGRCRLFYYGRLANGNPPTVTREETDRDVASGETITMVLSTGGGLNLKGNPNFQGYMIAQCDFRFAHGFAFITDGPIGQARVAEGYLALVIDGSDANNQRGTSVGEALAH